MLRSAFVIAAALAAASPAVAHASNDLSRSVRLAEVSADPRDGMDTIELRNLRGFTHLELRAREALVDIHGLGLRLHDGRIQWMNVRARIAPGERRTIELPSFARGAEAVVVDYGDRERRRQDRTPARLELYGATAAERGDERYGRWNGDERYGRWERSYRREPDARYGARQRPNAWR